MMQNQETERSTSFSETVVYSEASQTAENIQLITDFDNIEDILDFNLDSPADHEASNSKGDKKRPPMQRKMIAQEPVKLLELKPIIDQFVDDGHKNLEDDADHETDHETETKSRRFRCIVCGIKFMRSTHLHRHMRLHTGAKPYACSICRKRFSRSDYMLGHTNSHHTDKLHCCCVCGEVYYDLARFADHCCSHDDSEYITIAMSNTPEESKISLKQQVQVVEVEIPVTTAAKQIELNSCVKIEKVDNSTDEECIVCIKNPTYVSHYQAVSINNNDVTSVTSSATSLSSSTSTTDGLIVSITIKH